MVRRFKPAIKYRRGSRTHGWGRVGQHRKSGSSGGRGKSGRHKHKWTWVMKYAEDSSGYPFFGKHGFYQPVRVEWKPINLGELDELVERFIAEGRIKMEDGKYVVNLLELGYNKLLGGGRVTKPIIVYTPAASMKAIEKVAAVGGEVRILRGVAR